MRARATVATRVWLQFALEYVCERLDACVAACEGAREGRFDLTDLPADTLRLVLASDLLDMKEVSVFQTVRGVRVL